MDPLSANEWQFPTGRSMMLDNGLRVRLVDMPGRFVATVAVTIDLPTEVESLETEGAVAAWTALLLLDGPLVPSGGIGATARIGAAVTSGCDHRGPKIMADCPVTDVAALCEVLALAVFDSDPSPSSFELIRRRRTTEFDLETRDSFGLANKLLNESVLAPASRYARSVSGTPASWRHLRVHDVRMVRDEHVDPRHATVTVVGDLADLDAASAVEAAFGSYRDRGLPAVPDLPPMPGGRARLTHRRGHASAQTQLLLGSFALDRLDPRWASARILAELLGGGVDGLLDAQLRGRHGLTYGVDVRFLPYRRGGLFTIAGKVSAAQSEQAMAIVFEVLGRAHSGDLDPAHIERVRERMISSAPETYESTLAVAQQHAELASCDLEPGYIDAHLTQLRTLGVDQIVTDARSLLNPSTLHAAVVGTFDPDASVLADLPRC